MDGNGSDLPGERTDLGRFTPGHRGGPGRTAGASISGELRRICDPERIARYLIGVIEDPKVGHRYKLQACELITNRLEGKAVARAITMSADRILPAGFDALPRDQKRAALLELRQRALAGADMTVGAPDED